MCVTTSHPRWGAAPHAVHICRVRSHEAMIYTRYVHMMATYDIITRVQPALSPSATSVTPALRSSSLLLRPSAPGPASRLSKASSLLALADGSDNGTPNGTGGLNACRGDTKVGGGAGVKPHASPAPPKASSAGTKQRRRRIHAIPITTGHLWGRKSSWHQSSIGRSHP